MDAKDIKKEYIVIKLGSINGVDFYEEHRKLLEKHRYVDFARFGKSKVKIDEIIENTIFIKESSSDQGRLFKATIGEMLDRGEIYPDYYRKSDFSKAQWFRIRKIDLVDFDDFCEMYTNRQGQDVTRVFRGMNSIVHVCEKDTVR